MTQEELVDLYKRYLKRTPSTADIAAHLNKPLDSFEKELSECDEYRKLKVKNIVNSGSKIAILLSGHIRKNTIAGSIITKLKKIGRAHV